VVELKSPHLALALLFGLTACDACDGERTVPFKRDRPKPVAAVDAGEATATTAQAAAFLASQGQSLPAGSQTAELGGSTLRIAKGELRSTIESDVDGDGDADALLVRVLGDGAIELALATRGANGLDTMVTAARLLEAERACPIEAASLHTIASSHVEARVQLACKPAADDPEQALPNEAEHHLWVLTRERRPRIVMHLAWTAQSTPLRSGIDGVAVVGRDLDDDGHGDIEVNLEHGTSEALVMRFLNRAAGLARDPAEPEATLGAMVKTARGLLAKNPVQARQRAEAALGLHAAVCREPGTAALWLDDAQGLACGSSRAAGRAAAIATAALARSDDPLAALEAFAQIDATGRAPAEVDRKLALDALHKAIPNSKLSWRKGPTFAPRGGPPVRRTALSFIDESSLLLHGSIPQRHDLQTGTTEPAGLPGATLLTDPSGKHAAVQIVRSCAGYHVRIVRTEQVIGATIGGGSVAEPLVEERAAPPGASCPQLPKHLRDDDGGLRVLDWTDNGIILARRSQLYLLRLDANLQASGPAGAVGPADALRPRLRGALDQSGRKLALVNELGVVVVDRAAGSATRLPLPEGVAASGVSDVALSPSGSRLALVHAGRVYIAMPPKPAAPAPTTPATPAAPKPTP
jgi:hypothetical protein